MSIHLYMCYPGAWDLPVYDEALVHSFASQLAKQNNILECNKKVAMWWWDLFLQVECYIPTALT